VYVLYITSLRTKVLKEELLTTETTNELRQQQGWRSVEAGGSLENMR